MISNSFYPDWDYGPSDIIKTFLDIKNIELSSLNSNQQAVIDRFLMDDSISDNESIQVLSEIFNCDSVFWENIFRQYERNVIRIEEAEVDENYGEFQELLNDLAEANWLSKTNSKYINQSNLKAFFNIPSHQLLDYTIIYEDTIGSSNFKRISDYVSSNLNLATLIKKAEWELKKQNIDILWDRQLFSENLQKIKLLSKKRGIKNFSQELNRLCNEAGVGLIILETLPQTPIRGISKFTNDGRPFIVITTKYNLDHIFWQTFFHEAGICQHSCHPYLNQATKTPVGITRLDGRTGLRAVGSTGEQFLTAPLFQRAGFACFAITSTDSRLARISPSLSVWRSFGVTKFNPLCLCSALYQPTKPFTHTRALSKLSKPCSGKLGAYLTVRNSASANGLSLLTRGRL